MKNVPYACRYVIFLYAQNNTKKAQIEIFDIPRLLIF